MWQYATISAILLAQSFSELVSDFLSLHSGGIAVSFIGRIIASILLGFALSTVSCDDGIRDLVLMVHACCGLLGFVSNLALPLGIEKVFRWKNAPFPKNENRRFLLSGLVLCSLCLTLLWLQLTAFTSANRDSSACLLFLLISVWIDRIFQSRNIEYRDCATSPDYCSTQLEVFRAEPVVIEGSEIIVSASPENETSLLLEKVSSPMAETTPSDFSSETRWMLDLTDDGEEASSNEWFYVDLTGTVQGPFASHVMQAWYKAGHLRDSLRISNRASPHSSYASIGDRAGRRGGRSPFE